LSRVAWWMRICRAICRTVARRCRDERSTASRSRCPGADAPRCPSEKGLVSDAGLKAWAAAITASRPGRRSGYPAMNTRPHGASARRSHRVGCSDRPLQKSVRMTSDRVDRGLPVPHEDVSQRRLVVQCVAQQEHAAAWRRPGSRKPCRHSVREASDNSTRHRARVLCEAQAAQRRPVRSGDRRSTSRPKSSKSAGIFVDKASALASRAIAGAV